MVIGPWPKLKIDVHVHTNYSDSKSSVREVIEEASRKGLDGLAITDHGTLRGAREALNLRHNLLIIPGEEIKTKRGDLLARGIRRAVPEGLDAVEAIDRVHGQGGLVIVPHPTVPFFGKFKGEDLSRLQLDGLEVFSAITPFPWRYARKNMKLAQKLGVAMVAGSDSHNCKTVGDAYTIVKTEEKDLDSVLRAIKDGETRTGCNSSKIIFKIEMLFRFLL
ncbi:MAG: PHP domain-containing protein [Candidatus Bathyarchaeia archaeon]